MSRCQLQKLLLKPFSISLFSFRDHEVAGFARSRSGDRIVPATLTAKVLPK